MADSELVFLAQSLEKTAEQLVGLATDFGQRGTETVNQEQQSSYQHSWDSYQQTRQQYFDYFQYRLLSTQYSQLYDRKTALDRLVISNPEIPTLISPLTAELQTLREDPQWRYFESYGWAVPGIAPREAPEMIVGPGEVPARQPPPASAPAPEPPQILEPLEPLEPLQPQNEETLRNYLHGLLATEEYALLATQYPEEQIWDYYLPLRSESFRDEAGAALQGKVSGPLAAQRYALFRNQARQHHHIDNVALTNLLFCLWNEESHPKA